MILKGAKMR